jgi:hypothetical protein
VAALREIAEAATELQSQDVQAAKVIELSKKVSPCISAEFWCMTAVQICLQMVVHMQHTLCSGTQNRSLNLLLEKERQKVAKLQQSLSQASSKEAGTVSCRSESTRWRRVTCMASCRTCLHLPRRGLFAVNVYRAAISAVKISCKASCSRYISWCSLAAFLQGKQTDAKEGNAEMEALSKEVAVAKEKISVMTKKIGHLEAKVNKCR